MVQEAVLVRSSGKRGSVSIVTGALKAHDHNRDMIADWDLRAASILTSYFSRQQYRPIIEDPIYQFKVGSSEAVQGDGITKYTDRILENLKIYEGGKTYVIIASADVNPLTEIILGRLYGVEKSLLFKEYKKDEDLPTGAGVVAVKQRKKDVLSSYESERSEKVNASLLRAFYREKPAVTSVEKRGYYCRVSGEKLEDYYGPQELPATLSPFYIYAHLVVALNPFSSSNDEHSRGYFIVLNGVAGPATLALAQMLTGEMQGTKKPAKISRNT